MRKKIKIVSLFSGCGGLDLGFTGGFSFLGHDFERLNTEIAFANDFDADAQICYNSNPLLTNDGAQCLLEDIKMSMQIKFQTLMFYLLDFHVNLFQMQEIAKV